MQWNNSKTALAVTAAAAVIGLAAAALAWVSMPGGDTLVSREGMTYKLVGRKDFEVAGIVGMPDRKLVLLSECDASWYYDSPPTREKWSSPRDTGMMVVFSDCRASRVSFWPRE